MTGTQNVRKISLSTSTSPMVARKSEVRLSQKWMWCTRLVAFSFKPHEHRLSRTSRSQNAPIGSNATQRGNIYYVTVVRSGHSIIEYWDCFPPRSCTLPLSSLTGTVARPRKTTALRAFILSGCPVPAMRLHGFESLDSIPKI